jgi:hypothetical protein
MVTFWTLEMQARNQNQGSRLIGDIFPLHFLLAIKLSCVILNSDPSSMTSLRKPPEFEGFPLFATGMSKVDHESFFSSTHRNSSTKTMKF